MAQVRLGDASIGFAIEGPENGIPLVFLHGTTMDRAAWDMVRAALPADTYRCILVEFPGSGESSMANGSLTVEGLVAHTLAVADAAAAERFHVAGFSLGAVIALATAATVPDRVRSVTSLCGWATTDARMRVTFDLWKRLISVDRELFMRYVIADGFTLGSITVSESVIDALIPFTAGQIQPGSLAQLDLDISIDIAGLIDRIVAPTLVIGATEDRWVDVAHSRSLADRLSNARLVELPAAHMVIQELAVEVAAALDEHVRTA